MTLHSSSRPAGDSLRMLVITTAEVTMGNFFARQIGYLAQEGFRVHAACSPGPGLDKVAALPGVATHPIPMARQPHPLRDIQSFLALYSLMRRIRPEIVHAHTPKAGLLGMAAARAAGVPVRLYTIHGLPLLTRRGKWRRVLEGAEKSSCALATQVYSVSPSLRDLIAELRLCPDAKLATLGNGSCAGLDVERFDTSARWSAQAADLRRTHGIPAGAQTLTFVGRIARDKGIAILAVAWRELAAEFSHLHLLFAGEEDESDPVDPAVLRELCSHPRVHFTGSWDEDIPAFYAATDILVLPTFREGLGQVVLEAGAMGVPVVSTRIPGVVNALRDGETGLLVPPREVSALTHAVRRLVLDVKLRATLGAAAREYVRTRFSEQFVNQLWISEYRKLAHRSNPKFASGLAQAESPR